MSSDPVVAGTVGDLFHVAGDAVVVVDGQLQVVAWSPGATILFGVSREDALAGGAVLLAEHVPTLVALPPDGSATRRPLPPYGVLEVRHRTVGAHHLLLMRDVSDEVRRSEGLRSLSRLSRGLLALQTPSLAAVLATVAAEARSMAGAGTGVVMLLRPGSLAESTHVVTDGPQLLLPAGPPRFVGVLATPVRSRKAVRLADLDEAPDGAGIPGRSTAIGPFCAVPLLAGPDVLGLLALASPPGARTFDQLDEELLVDLAGHTAVAVRWAQGAEKEAGRLQQRAEIISTARHDVRTPLGAGKGYLSLLRTHRDRMSPEQIGSALDGLQQAFDRIELMTEQLLMDDKLETAGAAPRWAVIDLVALLDEVRRDAGVLAGRPDAVRVTVDEDGPSSLAGDPGMVREVLDNLVGNALKYAGGAGPVTVTARQHGADVRLSVRDEGPGISPAEQPALFERWTRSETARDGTAKGFGLGLSIVRRLVLAHGGAVGVESDLGAGATFWVTFPAARPDLPGPGPTGLR